jgi:hypothetical protein
MKTVWILGLVGFAASMVPGVARADDFREWRDVKTGNTLVAKIVDKRETADGTEVQLLAKDTRRTHWINVLERLLPTEEAYVKAWVKPENRFKFLNFEYSPKHRKDMAWFKVETGNHGIRVVVEPTGKPAQEFEFAANTNKKAALPAAVFNRNKAGVSLAVVKVYSKDSGLYLYSMRDLK